MKIDDYDKFEMVIRRLAEVFGKPVTTVLLDAYWDALKDQDLGVLERRAVRAEKICKFFPKPSELRPKEEKMSVVEDRLDPHFEAMQKRAIETLEDLRRSNPDEWLRHVSGRIYELGRAKGMFDGEIAEKIRQAIARP